MPTLKATFEIMDKMSGPAAKIAGATKNAGEAVRTTSRKVDDMNASLRQTKTAAGIARDGLMRIVGAMASIAAVQKGMGASDAYTNMNSRLSMITDSLEEQKALHNQIFAAAQRARGSYYEMADSAVKLRMLAGDSFGSNAEALGFSELLAKSFKVSGADVSSQKAAMTQITQAMTSGRLQGDEFRSVMENAPMLADAIAQYMGKSKAELKALSSEGLITADIIKGALFRAADDINGKFAEMKPTFADTWVTMKNQADWAFEGVYVKANNLLNSDMGQTAVRNLIGVLHFVAWTAGLLLDAIGLIGKNMDLLTPVIYGAAVAWAVYNAASGIGWLNTLRAAGAAIAHGAASAWETIQIYALIAAQDGLNVALAACPIAWIIMGIIAIISVFFLACAAVAKFTDTTNTGIGIACGVLSVAAAFVVNLIIGLINFAIIRVVNFYNLLANFAAAFGLIFNAPVAAIKAVLLSMFNFVLNVASAAASVLDTLFGSNLADAVNGFQGKVQAEIDTTIREHGGEAAKTLNSADYTWQRMNYKEQFDAGAAWGNSLSDKIGSLFGGKGFDPSEYDAPSFEGFGGAGLGSAGNPSTVKGTGAGGAVKVENEEDIAWLRKLAERDYIARIAQNTLAPTIKVEFSGPITKEADTDKVTAHITEVLKESIATAPEGLPV